METIDIFSYLANAPGVLFSFVKYIPSMLSQCLIAFPSALVTILLAGFLVVIAIRVIELLL